MKKIVHILLGRLTIVALLILVQFAWLVTVMYRFSYQFAYANISVRAIAVIVTLVIVNKWSNPEVKLSWTFLILLSPVLGLLIYAIFGRSGITKKTRKKMRQANEEVMRYLKETPKVNQELALRDKDVYRQSKYINDYSHFPIYAGTKTQYFPSGEEMFPAMLAALEEARHFIFLEYFIVEEGEMFGEMLAIMERKAREGVDVRVIYDDVGCISTLPSNYYLSLEKKGIRCVAFNPFRPILSVVMNNRDHRKILVVDGVTGFTGGINLADEYINRVERFGYWKDAGVCLHGEAVFSLTVMFLSMWNYISGSSEDYSRYRPKPPRLPCGEEDGYVQPYGDSPLEEENVAAAVYLNIINSALDYVYIYTPYLIVDNEILRALMNAAKRGVDVRLVTPGVPDKKLIFLLTQSFYPPLIKSGVKVYQYRPGFIHAKCFVSDDKLATVGSINLDNRSLYLHFECGVFLYRTPAIAALYEDCMDVFRCSDEISLEYCMGRNVFIRMFQGMVRLLAPLL